MLATQNHDTLSSPVDMQDRLLAIDPMVSSAVIAPAGSGKTSILLARFLGALCVVDDPEEVLAITFTNDAANEILERVMAQLDGSELFVKPQSAHEYHIQQLSQEVQKRDKQLGWNLKGNPQRLRIMTIDAYCAQLVNDLPVSTGVGGPIKPDDDPQYMYREAVINVLGMIDDPGHSLERREVVSKVLSYANYRYESLLAPVIKLLAKRDQWLLLGRRFDLNDANAFLAEFNKEMIYEFIRVLNESGADQLVSYLGRAASFNDHKALAPFFGCASLPSADNREFYVSFANYLLTGGDTLRKQVTTREGIDNSVPDYKVIKDMVKGFSGNADLETICASVKHMPPCEYGEEDIEFVNAFYAFFELCIASLMTVFKSYSRCDFTEIALRAHDAIGDFESGFGEGALKEGRTRHLMVDEMQDTGFGQVELLAKLVRTWEDDPETQRSLFMCGDISQSIYLFRGAEPWLYQSIWKSGKFAGHDLRSLSLKTNFRSAPELIDHFNGTFSPLFRSNRSLFVEASAHKASGGEINYKPYIVKSFQEEARLLVDDAINIASRRPNDSIAILARNRSHFKEIIQELRVKNVGFGGKDLVKLVELPHIIPVLAITRIFVNSTDRLSWIELFRSNLVGISWNGINQLMNVNAPKDVLNSIRQYSSLSGDEDQIRAAYLLHAIEKELNDESPLATRVNRTWMALNGHRVVDDVQQVDVNTFFKAVRKHACGAYLNSVNRFNSTLEKLYSGSSGGNIRVMTFHGCKGLEFDHVLLAGLSRPLSNQDSLLAEFTNFKDSVLIAGSKQKDRRIFDFIRNSKKLEEKAEELRTLYVAMTRAKKTLSVYCGVLDGNGGVVEPKKNELLSCIYRGINHLFDFSSCTPELNLNEVETYEPQLAVSLKDFERFTPINQQSQIKEVNGVLSGENFDLFSDREVSVINGSVMDDVESVINSHIDSLSRKIGVVEGSISGFVEENELFIRSYAMSLGVNEGEFSDFKQRLMISLAALYESAVCPF